MSDFNAPKVKIINPEGSGWLGTHCFIDDVEIKEVISADFHVGVDECPTFDFETHGLPNIEMRGITTFRFAVSTVDEAISVLRHELLKHGEIYDGFKASLKAAINLYYPGELPFLPFETEDESAGKILDFIIGKEKSE